MEFGFLSVIPPVCTILLAVLTKNVFLALMIGVVLGYLILDGGNVIAALSDSLNGVVNVFTSTGNTIVLMSILLIGAIIYIIEKSGGITGFVDVMIKKRAIIKSKKGANFFTWLLGVLIFTSGSLSCMVVGSVTRPINDALKVPHEKAAFLVHSTSTPVCVLIPLSGWLASMIGYLTSGGVAEGDAMTILVESIPLNFYCVIAVVGCLVLSLLGIDFGPMKKAEERVKNGGPLAPEGSSKIDIRTGSEMGELPSNPKAINLFIPIFVLVLSTVLFDMDMQKGVLVTLGVMFVWFLWQNLMKPEEFADVALQGLKNMILPLMLMVLAFLFAEVNNQIHFTYYVITTATNYMTPSLMPFAVFVVLAATEFITGTNWGMYIIALPIVIPLAINLDANITLAVSAVLSAGVFGSHICFYSDATVITSAATGCDNFRHAITQAPFGLLAAGLSALCYLTAGAIL